MSNILKTILALSLTSLSPYIYHSIDKNETFPQKLERIVYEVNNSNTTWKAEHYPRWEKETTETIRSFMGGKGIKNSTPLRPEELEMAQYFMNLVAANYPNHSDLPDSFFSSEKWPECPTIKQIYDQSQCGSCWAVSSSSTMTDRICIHSKGRDNRKISALDILSCCKVCGDGCFGGEPILAFKEWVLKGYVTGGTYGDQNTCKPYNFPPCAHHFFSETLEWCMAMLSTQNSHDGFFNTPKCNRECSDTYVGKYWDDLVFGKSWYAPNGEQPMMQELYVNGPFVVEIELFDDFFGYKSGVYQYVKGESHGFHDVRIVGYGEEVDGTKYWMITNSWNVGWGDNGYIKILRGVNMIGIESNVSAGIPD